jgi:hypothetical protein
MNQEQLSWMALAIWEMAWKGVAMWKAAQKKQLKWYIALFVINSMGILSIAYIYQDKILPFIPKPIKNLFNRWK